MNKVKGIAFLLLILGLTCIPLTASYAKIKKTPEEEKAERVSELCLSGTPSEIQAAIQDGSLKVDEVYNDGVTPIMYAAFGNKDPQAVQVLIDAGSDVDQIVKGLGITPVMEAIKNPNPEVLKVLINAGATVTAYDLVGDSPNAYKDTDTPLYTMTGGSPLIYAAMQTPLPDVEIFKTLIEAGANVNARNANASSCMILLASKNTPYEILKLFVDAGVPVDERDVTGKSILMLACLYNNDPRVISMLLDEGADAAVTDWANFSAADYAAANPALKDNPVFKRLLAKAPKKEPNA